MLARAERDPSAENLDALRRWREAGPRHKHVLRSSEAVLRGAVKLPGSNIAVLGQAAAERGEQGRSRFALAATLAGALLIGSGAFLILVGRQTGPSIAAVLLTTNVGEIREVRLSDGSKLILDTKSAVRVEVGKGRRRALVEQGRARFSVARQNVPFMIRTGVAAVRLDAGIVDVSGPSLQSAIKLINGDAQITRRDGNQDRIIALHGEPGSTANPPLPDWTTGRLSFDGARLDAALAAANRYNRQQILIGDAPIASLRVTGVFRTDDPEGLARSLAAAFSLDLQHDTAGNLVLRRRR